MASGDEERRVSSILSRSPEEADPKPLKVTSGKEMDSSNGSSEGLTSTTRLS